MEWKEYTFNEVATLTNGRAYLQPELQDSGKYRIVRVGNLSGGDKWFYSDMELPDNKYCNNGDLLYAWACSFGPYIWNNEKTIYHYHIWKVDVNATVADKMFLYYYLKYYTPKWMGLTNGSVMMHITKGSLEKQKICLPPLETQQRISSVLSAFDDKIAINRKICANLEAQAQALFKHWFIDFAPFKDGKFVESELGMIPEGWKVGTLGEIAEFKRGKTIIKSETKEGKIPVVAGGLEPAYYHNKSNTSSRVITISGSGANAGFTRMYYEPVWASDCSYADIETTPYLHTAYCYLLVNRKSVNALQWGAAQPHVYPKDINKLPHVLAPYEILLEFEELIKVLFNRIDVCVNESSRLSSLRDTLLPKLMSGEIKI